MNNDKQSKQLKNDPEIGSVDPKTGRLVIDTKNMLWQYFDLEHFENEVNLTPEEWREFVQSSEKEFSYATRELVEVILDDWLEENDKAKRN